MSWYMLVVLIEDSKSWNGHRLTTCHFTDEDNNISPISCEGLKLIFLICDHCIVFKVSSVLFFYKINFINVFLTINIITNNRMTLFGVMCQ